MCRGFLLNLWRQYEEIVMRVITINDKVDIVNPVVTIGIFDGVHKGHQYILNRLISKAKEEGGHSVVVTLWPHPRIVLNQDVWNFRLLHSQEEKIRHLEKMGIDYLLIVPFNTELASLDACEFVREYLIKILNLSTLLIGHDNKFGKDRKGDPEGLSECSGKFGFKIEKIDEYTNTVGNVSSTLIRKALLEGELGVAKEMLNYEYYLGGTVIQGNHVGHKLGYPTANINPHTAYKLIPRDGVYAARAEIQDKIYNGMMNIGVRPTLDSANPVKTIEVHLFDFEGDIYEEDIVVYFNKRIRDEKRFNGMENLRKQLVKDEAEIRSFYSK